jgi:anthranilate phosphoribosyltransferase
MNSLLDKYVDAFRSGQDLAIEESEQLLDAMIASSDEPMLATLFEAWNEKGIAEDEIFGIARVMRDRCTKISTTRKNVVDVVGTGGSKVKTFNVSTAAAFVVAGAGVPVAKHGNRAATSSTGSADVLSALGVEPAVDAETAARCLDEVGICFMFAPNYHRLSPTLAKVRRGLGFPTIFNCVGPLCNPASAPHQLIGVWDKELVPKMANALARLGTKKSWIVHGSDGLDEITLGAPTFVAEVENEMVVEFELVPGEYWMPPDQTPTRLQITGPAESAEVIRGVLSTNLTSQPAENLVLMNAAAAICLAGRTSSFRDGLVAASESIYSGKAMAKLSELERATKK